MMDDPRVSRRILIRMYPRAWRQRYGEEFALLLEATPLSIGIIANVIGAAAREWLVRTFAGLIVLGMSVAWSANVVARFLSNAIPTEVPSTLMGGVRVYWAPWPSYLGLVTPLLLLTVIVRYSSISQRPRGPVGDAKFAGWVAAFFVAAIGSQWGDMIDGPGVSAQSAFSSWKEHAMILTIAFVFLRNVLKHPVHEVAANRK